MTTGRPVSTVSGLVALAASLRDFPHQRISSAQRDPEGAWLRFAVMWAAHRGLGATLGRIGRALGDRDHSTINYGLKRAVALRLTDPDFRQLTNTLLASTQPREQHDG